MSIIIAYRGSDSPADIEASGVLWVDGQPLAALGVPFVTPKGEKPIAQMADLQKRLYPGDQWHPQFDAALDYAKRIRDHDRKRVVSGKSWAVRDDIGGSSTL